MKKVLIVFLPPPTHVIQGLLIAAGLSEQRVAAHIVLGTGSPVQRRLARYIDLMCTLRPQPNQILQHLGVSQPGGLVYDIQPVAIFGRDQCRRHWRLQLLLQCLQIVIDHCLMQILAGILREEVKEDLLLLLLLLLLHLP